MPPPSPRHNISAPPRRMLAVGGAAVVTLVTVAGGLGFGPGAADATAAPANGHDSVRLHEPALSGTDSPPEQRTGRSWLTIDRSPASDALLHDSGTSNADDADRSDDATESSSPPAPSGSGSGERVVFDIGDQRVWLVDADDDVVRTYAVSGSRHDNLQPGTYEVYSRSRHAVSFDGRETMRFMVRFAHGENAPIGFHDIPRRPDGTLVESRSQLGTPLSAGCIRQWPPDAKALWAFAPVGTQVVVTA